MNVLHLPLFKYADRPTAYVPSNSINYWEMLRTGNGSVVFLLDGLAIETPVMPDELERMVLDAEGVTGVTACAI